MSIGKMNVTFLTFMFKALGMYGLDFLEDFQFKKFCLLVLKYTSHELFLLVIRN